MPRTESSGLRVAARHEVAQRPLKPSGDALLRKARQENFPVAAYALPGRYRRHLLAVYGFARLVDDLGDEAPPEDRLGLLDEVADDVERLYARASPRLPVIRALAPTVAASDIPIEEFQRLIEANRRDQQVTRYDTFDELLGYCELSANPVGHLVLHIFGAATPERFERADRVCSALQVIEHCQDVGEDYASGRIYLPGEDRRRFGCAERDLAEPMTATRLRGVVALQARRSERLLNEGAPLVDTLSGFARVAVGGFLAGGRATLHALDRAKYDVLGHRVRPNAARTLTEWLVTRR